MLVTPINSYHFIIEHRGVSYLQSYNKLVAVCNRKVVYVNETALKHIRSHVKEFMDKQETREVVGLPEHMFDKKVREL